MKRFLALTTLVVLLVVSCCAVVANASPTLDEDLGDALIVTPAYSYTDYIVASLSFSGNTANCAGMISPSGSDNVTIFVVLYRQNGSGWDYVKGWGGSGTGGASASAGGSVEVTSGTYKVVASGSVGITLEHPSVSVTRTLD